MEITPGEKLRLVRLRRGITQEGLALQLNISQMQISRIERGVLCPKGFEIEQIEKVLGEKIWTANNGNRRKSL